MAGTAGPRGTELTAGRVARARAPMAGPRTGSPQAARPSPGLCAFSPGCVPPGYAHKDPDLRNTHRTQGRNQALVCGAVFPNSLPCVRHREGRAVTGHAPRPAGPEGGGRTDARYWHRRALLTPTRVVDTSARYTPLAVSTTPSRCRQPPRGVNDPLAMSTTPSRCQRPPHGVDNARRRTASVRAPALPGTRRRRPRGPPRRARRRSAPVLPGARRRRPRGPLLATGSSGPHSRIRRAC